MHYCLQMRTDFYLQFWYHFAESRGICIMDKFLIHKGSRGKDTISRTIRWNGDIYDRLMELSDKNNVSFNRIVNDAVRFALDRLDDDSAKR